MPIPSSVTVTSIQASVTCARTTTVPPSGEYLNAFSSSCPTMMSVAIVSPLAAGRSSGMSATTVCLSESGRNAVAAARSTAPRSNGPLLTGSWSAPAREPSSSCSTSRPSDPHRGPAFGVAELVPPAGQRAGEALHHGDRRAQLVTGRGQEQVLGLLELL